MTIKTYLNGIGDCCIFLCEIPDNEQLPYYSICSIRGFGNREETRYECSNIFKKGHGSEIKGIVSTIMKIDSPLATHLFRSRFDKHRPSFSTPFIPCISLTTFMNVVKEANNTPLLSRLTVARLTTAVAYSVKYIHDCGLFHGSINEDKIILDPYFYPHLLGIEGAQSNKEEMHKGKANDVYKICSVISYIVTGYKSSIIPKSEENIEEFINRDDALKEYTKLVEHYKRTRSKSRMKIDDLCSKLTEIAKNSLEGINLVDYNDYCRYFVNIGKPKADMKRDYRDSDFPSRCADFECNLETVLRAIKYGFDNTGVGDSNEIMLKEIKLDLIGNGEGVVNRRFQDCLQNFIDRISFDEEEAERETETEEETENSSDNEEEEDEIDSSSNLYGYSSYDSA